MENEKLVERLREGADWPEVRPISASELREAAAALTAAEARIKMLDQECQSSMATIAAERARADKAEAALLSARSAEPVASEIGEEEIARAPVYDGSIEIRLDDKGGVDEIVGLGVIFHIERMSNGEWFFILTRPDQSQEAFWLSGKGKAEVSLREHRPAPMTGPNSKPWTLASALLQPALDRARREGLEAAAQYLEACDDYGDRHKATEIRAIRKGSGE